VLRVAVVGAGFVGGVHVQAARVAGASVVGLATSTPERGRETAARLGVPRAFDSAEEAVTADDVDVVHICTPNHLHEPLALAALTAGKHVICEKPLALDVAGAQRLVDAAAKGQTVAAVPFVYRYYPTVHEARDRVTRGETGAVHLVHGSYLQDWLLTPDDNNWRVDGGLGGASRAFADIGSHWCDLAEFVTGHRLTRLSARTTTAVPERRQGPEREAFARAAGEGDLRAVATEDAAVMQFETDQGALGSMLVSQISAGRKNRLWLEVDGAHEALAFNQEEPETLWRGTQAATTLINRDATTMSPAAARLAKLPAGHPQGYQDCFNLFVGDVYETIRAGAAPDGMPTFAAGLRAAQITDAVLASSEARSWVDVAS
jgi:predicted dehydrogenase